jgi:hypothetical protein
MIGRKFSRLLVLSEAERLHQKRPRYKCACDCGNISLVEGRHLRGEKIKSCGCLNRLRIGDFSRTHGMTETTEYKAWCGIKRRCLNINDKRYPEYGGRGIKICDAWANSFEQFYKDMGERPSGSYSIERVNVNGNYEPSNCVWIHNAEQSKNRRSNVIITHNGKTMILSEWAQETGLQSETISSRIKRGWSIADALTKPIRLAKKHPI